MPIVCGRDLYLLLVIAVMRLVTPWSIETPRKWAAAGAASVAYRLSRGKRLRSEQGIEAAFRDALTSEQKAAIVKESFRQFWHDPFTSPRPLPDGDRAVVGLSHVHDALAAGRGVILWESSQFGGRVVSKRILRDAGLRICQVHASNHVGGFGNHGSPPSALRRRVIERYFDRYELRFVDDVIWLAVEGGVGGRRALFQPLRENRIVCMGNDGRYGQKFVSVPFFDDTRPVATGIVTLARATGATILPLFCVEEPPGEWRVIIEPPIRFADGADRDDAAHDAAVQYVSLLEAYIRRYPGQYRTWEFLRPRQPGARPSEPGA